MSTTSTTNDSTRTYRWVITTLVGLLCFSVGYAASTTQLRDTVIRNTVRIDTLERNMIDINKKLDILLVRVE